MGGVKWYSEITHTHRYLELWNLHFQHLQINFSNCRAGTVTKHRKPSVFLLDINMKLHCAKPYDNYISLANIYCIFDILIIKQLNPSFQLDRNALFFLQVPILLLWNIITPRAESMRLKIRTCKNNIFNDFGISNMLTSAQIFSLKAEQKNQIVHKISISYNQNMTFTKQNKM